MVAFDVDLELDRYRAVAESVVVEEPVGSVGAVGDRAHCFALQLLGLPVDLAAGLEVGVVAEAVEDGLEASLSGSAGSDLGVHVTDE